MNIYDMTCEFVRTNEYQYKCMVCGTTVSNFHGIDYPTLICKSKLSIYQPEDYGIRLSEIEPDTEENIESYRKIDDLKKCSIDEIEHRFAICASCEYYKNNTCEKCGCYLVRDQVYMNKLAWKDQECPLGKWKSSSR